jgi:alanyl-tRNA synthetase
LKAELDQARKGGLLDAVRALAEKKVEGAKGAWVVGTLPPGDTNALREAADVARGALGTGAAAFAAVGDGKVSWMAVVTDDLAKSFPAAEILKAAGVGGGGKPNLAQGGGKDVAQVPDQLRRMAEFLAARLESARTEVP